MDLKSCKVSRLSANAQIVVDSNATAAIAAGLMRADMSLSLILSLGHEIDVLGS